MDKVPTEICTRIFSFACLDSGYTGRSLSLVSRFVHNASLPVKLQSISLHGRRQITAFATLLKQTPYFHRHVRYLYISDQDPLILSTESPPSDRDSTVPNGESSTSRRESWQSTSSGKSSAQTIARSRAERKEQQERENMLGGQIADVLVEMLRIVGDDVEWMELAFGMEVMFNLDLKRSLSFPMLEELTIHNDFALEDAYGGIGPNFSSCPQLRRLHLAKCSQTFCGDMLDRVGRLAPALTYLRFSDCHEYFGLDDLAIELGIPADAARGTTGCGGKRLPSGLKNVLVSPSLPKAHQKRGGLAGQYYNAFLVSLAELSHMDERFVYAKAEDIVPQTTGDGKWLSRLDGGEGCWNLDSRV